MVSIFTQYEDEKEIRRKHHEIFIQNNKPEQDKLEQKKQEKREEREQKKQFLKPFAWLFVLTWFFLAELASADPATIN